MSATVIVTGSSGFLGTAVCKLLEKQFNVIKVRYTADIQKMVSECELELATNKPFAFFNIGGSQLNKDDPISTTQLIESNYLFPSSILSIIKFETPLTKFLSIGTSWEIDDAGEENPFSLYAATKYSLKHVMRHFSNEGIACYRLRLFDTYGPFDPRNKLVDQIITAYLNEDTLKMSHGEQEIDLVYIEDAASAVVKAAQLSHGSHLQEYEISSKSPILVKDLLREMNTLTAKRPKKINMGFYPYRTNERFKLNYKLPWVPDWTPSTTISQGLRSMLKPEN